MTIDTQDHVSEGLQETEGMSNLLTEWHHQLDLPTPVEMKVENDQVRLERVLVHQAVKHSVGEYVREQAHTNGVESFWSMLKRGYHGVYHHMSVDHLDRYIAEFEGRHNDRPADTRDQITGMIRGMEGKRLRYVDLVAGQGGLKG